MNNIDVALASQRVVLLAQRAQKIDEKLFSRSVLGDTDLMQSFFAFHLTKDRPIPVHPDVLFELLDESLHRTGEVLGAGLDPKYPAELKQIQDDLASFVNQCSESVLKFLEYKVDVLVENLLAQAKKIEEEMMSSPDGQSFERLVAAHTQKEQLEAIMTAESRSQAKIDAYRKQNAQRPTVVETKESDKDHSRGRPGRFTRTTGSTGAE